MVLPVVVLATGFAAGLMRQTRSSMIGSLDADYVRTARSKGLSEWRVVGRHALRNSLITVATLVALDFGALLSGAAITESVFSLPGFGRLGVEADLLARLRGDPGDRADHGARLRGRQLRRRHRLLAARPADQGRGSGAMTRGRRPRDQPARAAAAPAARPLPAPEGRRGVPPDHHVLRRRGRCSHRGSRPTAPARPTSSTCSRSRRGSTRSGRTSSAATSSRA